MRPFFRPESIHNSKCRHRRRPAVVASVLLWLVLVLCPAHAEIFDQYQVKAVFLYNLTNFITWPADKGGDRHLPFTIAVIGNHNLGTYLENSVDGESINGRRVVVKHFGGLEALQRQACDILFVSEDQLDIWPQIRAIARRRDILTVSDVQGFAHRGGMVNLLTTGRRISIEINIDAARRNGFEVSAKLLRLARVVSGGKDD